MTLSKLVADNDTATVDNEPFGYPNHKIATQRLFKNYTMGNMYYVRMDIGTPAQTQEMLIDSASSWSYLDTYNDPDGPERSENHYLLSEERDTSLNCVEAEEITIGNGRGNGIRGPACVDRISVQASPDQVANMPIVLRQNQNGDGPLAGGVLGLGPADENGGASITTFMYDQGTIDQNIYSIFPGNPKQDPKITFGGYQEEGQANFFYNEGMHNLVSLKISGSKGWSLPLRNINIGGEDGTNFKPKARNAQLDSGSNIVLVGKEDYKTIADAICDFVAAMENTNMTCRGRSDNKYRYDQLQLYNATKVDIMRLPHIKFQLDQYYFDMRPENYFNFIN